ncbi:tetratricopeptide repeat protein [Christiangramia sabulilitoris]|uniref:Uncharacterized protein n=1 Tax=Christiangramia sabulilitoris TaxID=2583991 RepID=A0A550I3H4_9FLAO|nr:hypothetical protein [Christiangramia sabulilitoris]TRO65368.1 hypothetical protein FGM01_08140 [Christiangramia sabulilitoris]
MRTIFKTRCSICMMLLFLSFSLFAQKNDNDMAQTLYETYKEKGAKEMLMVYKKNNTNKEYEGMAEPLNVLAYRLMQQDKDLEAAAMLLKAQMEEYPNEANPYDSYSDVLLEMGKKEEAKKHIEKSLELAAQKDSEENKLVIEAGKAKMAMLENKDKQLNFLIGNWDNETTTYRNGEKMESTVSSNNITFDNSGSIMIVDHNVEDKKACCKRVMVYNPNEDEFDVSYMRRDNANGISNSSLKVKEIDKDRFEVMEKFTNDDNEEVKMKHDIVKTQANVEWTTYASTDGNWEKVRTMNLKKKD